SATGEVFPLVIPDGAALLGDEPNKGNGVTPTKITHVFDNADARFTELVEPGTNSVLAGFFLNTSFMTGIGKFLSAVYVSGHDGVIVRNSSFIGSTAVVALRFQTSSSNVVSGNVITNNSNVGLAFNSSSGKVEMNLVSSNGVGVSLDTPAVDFGGG